MAYQYEQVRDFSKGTVTTVEDHAISRGAASRTRNMLSVGDGFEIVPGATLLGTADTTNSRVAGLGLSQDLNGDDQLYVARGTKIEHYNTATELWEDAKTGLTDDTDTSFASIQTPAGSFIFANSKTDGPIRFNLANPTDGVDLYNSARNFKGTMAIFMNRSYVVDREGYETTGYVSYIDNDFPYTAVAAENIGTGDGVALTFNDTLANPLVAARTVTVTAGAVTGIDDGSGAITGTGIAGTINYTTGAISVAFDVAPAGAVAITADYSYEDPTNEGIVDYRYTGAGRTAGQGDLIYQFDGSDPIKAVVYFKGVHYFFHTRSIWTVTFSTDDTTVENLIHRQGTGVANFRSVKAVNDGIHYIDTAGDKPVFRFLRYSELSGDTLPEEMSVNLDLTGYDFSDGAVEEWSDYILYLGRAPGSEVNDTMIYYSTRWKTMDFGDGNWRCFAKGQNALYAGSSISGDVYKLFDGYDIDDIDMIGEWEAKDDDLDIFELKKCKKFITETSMDPRQKVRVEASFDEADYVTIGTIDGSVDYGQADDATEYGALGYGSLYVGTITDNLQRHLKEFRFGSSKFMRAKIRFVAYGSGYVRVKMYTFKDIRKKGFKLPSNFR